MKHLGGKDIAVLMSTYNGEKYLREQIDSILSQKDVNVDLFVRDDGSTDHTVAIIKEYVEANSNIFFLDDHQHYGPKRSFFELLYRVHGYPYYAFADQDDIWKPRKLAVALEKMKGYQAPCLYCSNQTIYMDGKEKGLRFKGTPNCALSTVIHSSEISGCTMVFNDNLKRYVCDKKIDDAIINLRMHDVWMLLFALLVGKVIYDPDSYIDYRIHNNNTVGIPAARGKVFQARNLWHRILGYFRQMIKPSRTYSQMAGVLLAHLEDIREDDRALLLKYVHYRDSIGDRMALLLDGRTWRESSLGTWIRFAGKVLLGWI